MPEANQYQLDERIQNNAQSLYDALIDTQQALGKIWYDGGFSTMDAEKLLERIDSVLQRINESDK